MRRSLYLLAAGIVLAAALSGRAAVALNGGPSLCLLPLHLVTPAERFEKVARHFRAHPSGQHPELSRLDPHSCCRIAGNYQIEEPVTFWSILRGRQSHVVGTNVRSAIGGNLLNVATDLCGNVVLHRD